MLSELAVRIECPICKTVIERAPEDFPPRPFCSARCKLLDLGNWLNEVYRVPEPCEPTADEPDTEARNSN